MYIKGIIICLIIVVYSLASFWAAEKTIFNSLNVYGNYDRIGMKVEIVFSLILGWLLIIIVVAKKIKHNQQNNT